MKTSTLLVSLILLASGVAIAAKGGFVPVPAAHGVKDKPFELRIVGYDGSTNGTLTVEVRNTSKAAATFDAQGLYFVPQVATDKAPQRLGAPGPLQTMKGDNTWSYDEQTSIAAGGIVRVKLDVFCIDSHRASPTSETPFALASDRLPQQLAGNIRKDAKRAAETVGGYAAPAAKSSIQGEVWRNRDANWIELEGEGAQEAGKK